MQPQPVQAADSGLMLTGTFHVYTEAITFQSILLFKGLRILLLTLPAPSRMKNKREGWEDHMWQQCQNVAMKPQGSLLCVRTPGCTRARTTTWAVAYGSPVRHVLFLWLKWRGHKTSIVPTPPAPCPHHQHGKQDTWRIESQTRTPNCTLFPSLKHFLSRLTSCSPPVSGNPCF